MKKTLIPLFLLTIGVSSCMKEYHCDCHAYHTGGQKDYSAHTVKAKNTDEAWPKCNALAIELGTVAVGADSSIYEFGCRIPQ